MAETNPGQPRKWHGEVGKLFATAVSHYQAGRLAEAEAACGLVLQVEPAHHEALHLRGVATARMGKFGEAVESFRKALSLRPGHAELLSNLGNALRKLGRLAEAIECLRHARRLQPGFAEAAYNLALALQDQGQAEGAAAQLAEALRLRPTYPEALWSLGQVLQEQGKPEDAIARYQEALGLRPRYPEALFALGVLFAKTNRVGEAQARLAQYLALDPDDTMGARLVLARLGLGPLPERASPSQLRRIYQQRAQAWDRGGSYFGHELVARALTRICPEPVQLDILDAGCGTGLVGPLIQNVARRLDGVDLSAPMLDKARQKGAYTNLYQDDLLAFMARRPACYEVVVSAAALIHFGDLTSPFQAVVRTLRDAGLFVFTLFPNADESGNHGVAAAPLNGYCEGGCYLHGRDYICSAARGTGLSVISMATELHERYNGEEKSGLVVVCRRT
jgi:predicted TPR repeat methyltransferase